MMLLFDRVQVHAPAQATAVASEVHSRIGRVSKKFRSIPRRSLGNPAQQFTLALLGHWCWPALAQLAQFGYMQRPAPQWRQPVAIVAPVGAQAALIDHRGSVGKAAIAGSCRHTSNATHTRAPNSATDALCLGPMAMGPAVH